MRPKTEEFLNLLLWSTNLLARPTFRNLTDSYESWAFRERIKSQVWRLQKQGFVDSDFNARNDRLYRLSAQGRLHVLGGRDPESQWSRTWDGLWRLVLFDVPVGHNAQREALRRYLREKGFGYLQKSAWVTPDRLDEEREILRSGEINVESLLLLESRLCGGESNTQIVNGAWDFVEINSRYVRHLEILAARPVGALRDEASGRKMSEWASREREAWLAAVRSDPLLPEPLLPTGYLGKKSWHRRLEVLGKAGRQIRGFVPAKCATNSCRICNKNSLREGPSS